MENSVTFRSLEYTDYSPQIISTKLLDNKNREIKGSVGKGHIVTVQTILKNQDDKEDNIPLTLKVSDQSAGLTGITPLTGMDQKITVNGKAVEGDISSGIACTASPSGTVVEYKAKITGEVGSKIIIPHMAEDEYFSRNDLPSALSGNGKLYATGEWTVNRDLVSDYENKTTYDYSHNPYETSAYGWYRDNLTLTLNPGEEFDELYIDDELAKGGQENFTENTTIKGKDIELYGRLASDGSLSGIKKENIKIDKLKPAITLDSRSDHQMTLKDPDANPNPSGNPDRADILCSGIAAIEMKGPGETKYKVIDDTFAADDESWGPASTVFTYPEFTKSGTYSFRVMDAAGNYSDPYSITTQVPIIEASDLSITFADQSSYEPAAGHKVSVKDDETIGNTHLEWAIEKAPKSTYPVKFEKIEGSGTGGLLGGTRIPIGTYEVTFTLDGPDQDGNEAQAKKVKLQVLSGDPPDVNNPDNDKVDPDKIITDAGTGTKHALVTDSDIITVDEENPYKGGYIDMNAAKDEITERFHFVSQIKGDDLNVAVSIKQNGMDVTGINTSKAGTYVISYKVTDTSGCSSTVDFTLKIIDSCKVTFHADRGEFKNDGSLERTTTVKVGKKLTTSQIPGKSDLTPPTYGIFAGWSDKPHDDQILDVNSEEIRKDTTFYAVYDTEEEKYDGNITVTFFSADAATGKLNGDDGTRVRFTAEKGKTATLNQSRIPTIDYTEGSSLKGWKTDNTGNRLLTTEEICSLKLKGGEKITCIAYVEGPEKTETKVVKEQKTRVIKEKVKERTQRKENNQAMFIFYTSDSRQAGLVKGDGTTVTLTVPEGGKAILTDSRMPKLYYKNDNIKEVQWKTSITGDRMLTSTQLARLPALAGSTVSCTAYFKVEGAIVTRKSPNGTGKTKSVSGMTQFIGEEKVPLGASPNFRGRGNQCTMHWYMGIWAIICLIYELWSLHKRKNTCEPQYTVIGDWIYIVAAILGGIVLFLFGSCKLDLYVLAAGVIIIAAYTLRMKWLDHKERTYAEEIAD